MQNCCHTSVSLVSKHQSLSKQHFIFLEKALKLSQTRLSVFSPIKRCSGRVEAEPSVPWEDWQGAPPEWWRRGAGWDWRERAPSPTAAAGALSSSDKAGGKTESHIGHTPVCCVSRPTLHLEGSSARRQCYALEGIISAWRFHLGHSGLQQQVCDEQRRRAQRPRHHHQHVGPAGRTVGGQVQQHAEPVLVVHRHRTRLAWNAVREEMKRSTAAKAWEGKGFITDGDVTQAERLVTLHGTSAVRADSR